MRLSGWPVAVVVGVVVAAMIYIAVPVLQSPDQIAVDPPRTGSQRRREDTTAHQTNDYVIPVQRRKNLTYEEFVEEYLETQTPVVIVGVTDEWPSQRWTLDSIAELCGDQKVDLAKRGLDVLNTMDDAARARLSHDLEERHNTTIPEVIAQLQQGMDFQEFAEYIRSRRHIDGGNLWRGFPLERSFAKYLLPYNIHDQCIREEENGFCPELLSEVSISPFFEPSEQIRHTCISPPRLWVAPAGSMAYPAHLHGVPANIMSVMLKGCKRWTFWRYTLAEQLQPDTSNAQTEDADEIFWADPTVKPGDPHHTTVERYEVTVGSGDMLYVPCEMIHHVVNEDETMALSYAMLDMRSLSCAANLRSMGAPSYRNPVQCEVDEVKYAATAQGQLQDEHAKTSLPSGLLWEDFFGRHCGHDVMHSHS